jgi:glycosyltransferase involved in cell wall biosynthesis
VRPLPDQPVVTIVTPSLNTGRFIERTLRGVLDQTYEGRIEHVVLDSGSTDETPGILARYPSVRVVQPAPDGVTEKVNLGFQLAEGEVLGWINADDFYLPHAVTCAVEALRAEPDVALVYCNFLHVDEDGNEVNREASRQIGHAELVNERNWVPHQTAFFRREALQAVGSLDASFQLVQDWDLWIRLAEKFPVRYVDDHWGAFRVSRGQRSDRYKYAFWSQGRRMTRRHGARFFSPLFLDYYRGKTRRALRLVRRGQFRTFVRKARDFALSNRRARG